MASLPTASALTDASARPLQLTRTARFAVYGESAWPLISSLRSWLTANLPLAGFCFHAPILAQWFRLVDRIPFQSKGRAVVTKVAMDQTLWGPFSVSSLPSPARRRQASELT
jgi:hypothetical protein